MESTPIKLIENSTGTLVDALLHDEILDEHVRAQNRDWGVAFDEIKKSVTEGNSPKTELQEDAHWQWSKKIAAIRDKIGYKSLCIECAGKIEGMLILSFLATCRLPEQVGKDLVYLNYLASAPWNRIIGEQLPLHNRVGSTLFRAAVQVSQAEGLKGRLGLHSLPNAESFYRDKIGMSDLGPDPDPRHQGLRYFELSEVRATKV